MAKAFTTGRRPPVHVFKSDEVILSYRRIQHNGGLELEKTLSLTLYKNCITCAKEIVLVYFLLVNLSPQYKYHGMALHANFKDHCKCGKKQ